MTVRLKRQPAVPASGKTAVRIAADAAVAVAVDRAAVVVADVAADAAGPAAVDAPVVGAVDTRPTPNDYEGRDAFRGLFLCFRVTPVSLAIRHPARPIRLSGHALRDSFQPIRLTP